MSDEWVLPLCFVLIIILAICLFAIIVFEIKLGQLTIEAKNILCDETKKDIDKLEFNKWYSIDVYYKNQDKLDWALVQFKETKTGFMPLPCIAEYKKIGRVWTTYNDDTDRYLCELCEPIAFMLWKPYEVVK